MTAVEETYLDVEKLILKLVWSHVKRYGRDFNEALSDAHVGFMEAYKRFDGRVLFSTYCYWYVHGALLNSYNRPGGCSSKKKNDFNKKIYNNSGPLMRELVAVIPGDLGSLTNELSNDAQVAVSLALDLPRVKTPSRWKRHLFRHLRKNFGWTTARCIDTFTEIREAIK